MKIFIRIFVFFGVISFINKINCLGFQGIANQNKNSKKVIFFDLDGTVTDSPKLWDRAMLALIESKLNLEDGKGNSNVASIILNDIKEKKDPYNELNLLKTNLNLNSSIEELYQEKVKFMQDLMKQELTFIEGFEDFHKTISSAGMQSAITANSNADVLSVANDKLNLNNFFGNNIFTQDNVNKKVKPEPDIYLYAMKAMGLNPEDCIAIDDYPIGLNAASSAGITCLIGINTASTDEERAIRLIEFMSIPNVVVVNSYSELMDYLLLNNYIPNSEEVLI